MKYPDIIPTMQMAKKEQTRKKLDIVNGSRLMKENVPLLEEALKVRSGSIPNDYLV